MKCQKCKSARIVSFSAKCSDCFDGYLNGKGCEQIYNGYVPGDMNIGGGDYVKMEICLDCGQSQGEFPVPPTELEEVEDKSSHEE